MAALYPIKTVDEFRTTASYIDASFDIDNMDSSFIRAAGYIKPIISTEVWTLLIDHYNSDNYNQDDESDAALILLNDLVKLLQPVVANFALNFHFVFLQLRISSGGITLGDKDNTPYKYQTDEAKAAILESACQSLNILINKLTDNVDDITEWKESEQYTAQQKCLFKDEADFNKYFNINQSASFYYSALNIIAEIVDDEILTRNIDVKAITPERLATKVKKAAAYRTMARAAVEMDYYYLPPQLRGSIDNEFKSSNSVLGAIDRANVVRDKLSKQFDAKADQYFTQIDMVMAQTNKTAADQPYQQFDTTPDANDKFITML